MYNEERELPAFLAQFLPCTASTSGGIAPLRLVIVDNGSTDKSSDVVSEFARNHPDLPVVLLAESVLSVVQARIRGAGFCLGGIGADDYSLLACADADTRYDIGWIGDLRSRLGAGGTDAVGYRGSFPAWFWRMAPDVTSRYYDEIGTVFFPMETIEEFDFDVHNGLFTEDLFRDLPRLPTDHAFAITKAAYRATGGYTREYAADGHELLQESWSVVFRLIQAGGRFGYVSGFPCAPSPRRLVHESENELTAHDELSPMKAVRQDIRARDIAALERFVQSLDFDQFRRIVVRDLILMPAIADPRLLLRNVGYFAGIADALEEASRTQKSVRGSRYAWARGHADRLSHHYYQAIIKNLRDLRSL